MPAVPLRTLATVRVSAIPEASAIRTAIVFAVIVLPVTVTTFPERDTPAGTVAENDAPSTEYCQEDIVVLEAVPVTVALVGEVAPPAEGEVSHRSMLLRKM